MYCQWVVDGILAHTSHNPTSKNPWIITKVNNFTAIKSSSGNFRLSIISLFMAGGESARNVNQIIAKILFLSSIQNDTVRNEMGTSVLRWF